ncbi:hypothetical protein [uncultured Anaerococcus sp.]|uniref:hypothetical protein n=1 Tax=uncultured Anaerococcus sp. TaxID=293428 RepID=UPI00280B8915|nr:hypothetical protein [uncultured Anaerococcus sp.]
MTNYLDQLQFCLNSQDFDELTKNGSISTIGSNLNELENKLYNLEIDYEQKRFNEFLYTVVAKKQIEKFDKNFTLIVNLNQKISDMYRDKGEEEIADKLNREIKKIKNEVIKAIENRLDKIKKQ